MRLQRRKLMSWVVVVGVVFLLEGLFYPQDLLWAGSRREKSSKAMAAQADPELEKQISEIENTLASLHEQILRQKGALEGTEDPGTRKALRTELDRLEKERDTLSSLLRDLEKEKRASRQTPIDKVLQKARFWERRQAYEEQKEEVIRDRRAE